MNEVLQQRLVGALILVALGVIFWPIIFVPQQGEEGERGPERALDRRVPPRPQVSTAPLPVPDSSAMRASERHLDDTDTATATATDTATDTGTATGRGTEPDSSAAPTDDTQTAPQRVAAASGEPAGEAAVPAAPTERVSRSTAPEGVRLDAQGVPVAWVLQVASVSSADKAESLRRRLIALGYKAYVEQTRVDGRPWHRVYVGPKYEKARLEALRKEIDAEFDVQSMTRRWLP